MNKQRITPFLLVFAALVAGFLILSTPAQSATASGEDSKQVSRLLQDAKLEAHELEMDVEKMETFTNSDLSRSSHADQFNYISEHINKSGQLLTKLQNAREEGSLWQQKAIDEIEPLLRELADNTKAAIEYFNDNQEPVRFSATYREYLKANHELSVELAALITDYVDYGFHKSQFERLGEKMMASER